jgi:uncharacterized membrane protein (UPF0127 family)
MEKITVWQLNGVGRKMMGMLAYEKPIPITFETRWGIHTFGMKWPIDVMIVDGNLKVVKTVSSLKPNSIWLWNPIYNSVVEMPEGELKHRMIKIGDVVELHRKISENSGNL